MQRRFADAEFVAAIENTRLSGRKSDGVINHGSIDRAEIFNQERFAFEPDTGVTPRHFRFRIESRQIDFGKNVRVWIGASEQVTLFLQYERSIEFGGASDNEFRGGPRRMRQRTRCADSRQRLTCTAMRAEDIVSGNASATET